MALRAINILKGWFVTAAKPLQQQYHDWMDSYWHKSESIPMNSVTNLVDTINGISNLPPITGAIAAPGGSVVLPAGKLYREMILTGTGNVSVGLTPGGTERMYDSEISPVDGVPYNCKIDAYADTDLTLYITTQNDITYKIFRS